MHRLTRYMEQELVSIPSGSGKVDGLYYYSKGSSPDSPAGNTAIIHIHGFLGNFLDGSQRFLPPILAESGYSSLAINTRMANFGLFFGFGIIDDVLPQIDAAAEYLLRLGFENIIISGYSLGTCMVLRYAAERNDPERYPHLKGFISLATPYSMPESIRRRWNRWDSEPTYDEVYHEAREILKPDPYTTNQDRTILIYKARGSTYLPWHTEIYTYKTWWFLAGPEAETAKAHLMIERVKLPILLIQGWHDEVVRPEETHDLVRIALESGNEDVSAFYVNAGHTFEGSEKELGEIIVKWLDERFKA